jgi:ATP-dependent DNA helicase RecG
MRPEDHDEILRGESPHVERKSSHKDRSEILQAVCAFANDLDGSGRSSFLVVGVDDHGAATGGYDSAKAADDAQKALATILSSTQIIPHPSCPIHVASHQGHTIFIVEVSPHEVPPVVKVNGTAWVRKGTTTQRASESDLRRLEGRRPLHLQPFDVRPAEGAGLSDLDEALLRQRYNVERSADDDPESFLGFVPWLVQRGVGLRSDSGFVPSFAGLLVYGLSPQSYLSGAEIDVTRYRGSAYDADIIARKRFGGPLPAQLKGLWDYLGALIEDEAQPEHGVIAEFAPTYPLDALKELARNLVQHRDYSAARAPARISWFSDHIEFTNPGGPFGQASQGELGEHSDYRNPALTNLLVELGYVERAGRGLRRVRALLQRFGHPPLEIETNGFTSITLRRRS